MNQQSGKINIGIILGIVTIVVIYLLAKSFPDTLSTQDNQISLVQSLGILMLVGSGVIVHLKKKPGSALANIAIWFIFMGVLVFLYSYRHDIKNRFVGELSPSHAITTQDGMLEFRAAQDGHFYIDATIDNQPIQFMVDTGASDVVISLSTAKRLGINTQNLEFIRTYQTANGMVKGAPIRLNTIAIGDLVVHDVRASVNNSPMGKPLLGMSFLNKLHGYKVESDTLTLWP